MHHNGGANRLRTWHAVITNQTPEESASYLYTVVIKREFFLIHYRLLRARKEIPSTAQ